MMDILTCRLIYPTDPTKKLLAHQHFVGTYTEGTLVLYSISSLPGKEWKVLQRDGQPRQGVFLLTSSKQAACSLNRPSFVNCSTGFRISLSPDIRVENLAHRSMPKSLRKELEEFITHLQKIGAYTEYTIPLEEFIQHNLRLRK